MDISQQADALEQRTEKLKTSFEAARRDTSEQVRACLARAKALWRQLGDMKGSADIESMTPLALTFYARTCGWTLARAHARSSDPIAIAACLGDSDEFDRSITDVSHRYADEDDRDYGQFVKAIRSGRLQALEGV